MHKISQKQLKRAKQLLENDIVLAVPTETVYGLAVKLDNTAATEKLLQIKGRQAQGDTKFLPLMVPDVSHISQYAILSPLALKIARRHFPGALTMVLPKAPKFKHPYFDSIKNIGIRIPNHAFMLKLLELTGPLLVSSANLRNLSPCLSSAEVERTLSNSAVGAVVIGESGGDLPSTVISIVGAEIKVLRQGSIIFPSKTH